MFSFTVILNTIANAIYCTFSISWSFHLVLSHSSLGSTPEPPVAREPASPVVRVAAAVTLPPVGLPPRRAPAAAVLCGAPRRRVPAAVVLAVRGAAAAPAAAAGAAGARPRGELADDAAEAGVQGRALGPPVGEVPRVEPAAALAAEREVPPDRVLVELVGIRESVLSP